MMLLLDANVFINASRLCCSPTIAPTFWDWLAEEHGRGRLASVARIRKEIDDGKKGHLRRWAAELPASFWLAPDSDTPASMQALSRWVVDPARPYTQAARNEFLRVADYSLVAQAHAGGHDIVTFDQPRPDSKKRVLIPDACAGLGVQCLEPFSVCRRLGLLFS